jgi:glycosyltransferase involved in cell wall biosynthesis
VPPILRLAYLVSQYPAVNHTFILREIRQLRELGAEVRVVSIRRPDRPWEQLSALEQAEARETFSVLGAGAGAIFSAHLAVFFRRPLRYLSGLFHALRVGGADLAAALRNSFYFAEAVVAGHHLEKLHFTHLHSHFSSTVALFLSRVFPITFSVTIHGPDEFNDAAGFYLAEKAASARFLCAVSDYAASQLMKASDPRHWHKIEVAPLGVDTGAFPPRPQPENARFELLSVGRLAPAKAQPLLIAAIGDLVRQGRGNLHLRLVGEGPGRGLLEKWIEERGLHQHVTLEGACNQDRVREFYRQTDLFVLPSFAEGVPVVLMEAMAMEIPCLATWITGVPELIRHGIDGWLIPPGNEAELTAAIARLMDQADLRKRLGAAARARIQEKYELSANVRRLAGIYERRLSRNDS